MLFVPINVEPDALNEKSAKTLEQQQAELERVASACLFARLIIMCSVKNSNEAISAPWTALKRATCRPPPTSFSPSTKATPPCFEYLRVVAEGGRC